jgi:tetratricopeptide (TPR) repeat protein
MQKYRVGGQVYIQVTPEVAATLPMSSMSAALLLAEVYQHTDQPDKAIELLESLGSVTGQPVCALSLAELYSRADRFAEVLRVSEDFLSNTDDVTAQLLVFRASALADKGLVDAALTTLKEAMRFRSRDAHILRQGRYVRAAVYERAGRKALAKKDLERIYAEDPGFLDVAARLGVSVPLAPARPDV